MPERASTRRSTESSAPRAESSALKWIVAYKLAKAVVQGVIGLLLLAAPGAVMVELHAVAEVLSAHSAAAWSLALADRLVSAVTGSHRLIIACAVLLDGGLSCVEGVSLHRRYWWSRWLVVLATASFLPFELFELTRRPSAVRGALLAVNALVVFVLVRQRVKPEAGKGE